jgi:hypothetical protein
MIPQHASACRSRTESVKPSSPKPSSTEDALPASGEPTPIPTVATAPDPSMPDAPHHWLGSNPIEDNSATTPCDKW